MKQDEIPIWDLYIHNQLTAGRFNIMGKHNIGAQNDIVGKSTEEIKSRFEGRGRKAINRLNESLSGKEWSAGRFNIMGKWEDKTKKQTNEEDQNII